MHGARPLRSTRRLQNLSGVLPHWWKIDNKAAGAAGPTVVSIYDEIGLYGVSAGDFLAELRGISGDIELHISSPGGDVFDGIAIYNQLKQAQKRGAVHVVVDGIAASAASFIAQAASPGRLEMAPHSTMMIHDGFGMAIGNAADMREMSDQLDKASDNIAAIYADRTSKPAAYWRDLMRKETWLSDAETVSIGLADRILGDESGQSASWDLSIYSRWHNASGPVPVGDQGWVCDPDGTMRFDPDGDGDDDSTPEGDTDHDYFDEDGKSIKPVPPKPAPPGAPPPPAKGKGKGKKAALDPAATGTIRNKAKAKKASVDNTPWDAAKAWHNGTMADDPEAFYAGICAGKKTGDPDTQDAWALPYKYHPSDPPNAAGVRDALARLSQTQGLTNKDQAKTVLQKAMKKINPDYDASSSVDPGLLSAALTQALKGGTK